MLMTLDDSDDNKIRPQGLTIDVVVPQSVDLTEGDNINIYDKGNNKRELNDDVDDDIRELYCVENAYEEEDLIIEDGVK
jgi:hypothetical protein